MPVAKSKVLKVGDIVSVPATVFGQAWAREHFRSDWHQKQLEGAVVGKGSGSTWRLSFGAATGDDEPMEISLNRKDIKFVKRPEAAKIVIEHSDSGDDEPQAEGPMEDSSDEEMQAEQFFDEEPDHEIKTGMKTDYKKDITAGWKRDDDFCFDQRAKSTNTQDPPKLNMQREPKDISLFELGCHFLPMAFLGLMAAAMTTTGLELHKKGDPRFPSTFHVSVNDLLQWIGVWVYFLAFPQSGSYDAYWHEPAGGFGPRHKLQQWLSLGDNGEKNHHWFRSMNACFTLPQFVAGDADYKKDDPLTTRRFWYALRDAFYSAVTASWLLCMDESMVRWMGVGMPGLMVILRKPTPIGLELHTMCCAVCGILVFFEVYEGKAAMEKKEYCDKYPKSVALTLRMTKKFFGTSRVVIADSWFGSVANAIALYTVGLFCIMNVKTAHTNFPKDQIMEEVAEIKGNTADAKKRRQERRGKKIAFTQTVQVSGGRDVTLLAAGHNKKVPLLVIATTSTMLPGEEHNKAWKVNHADGSVEMHSLKTPQPAVHALYRLWMNVVDLHNKLRQGVVSMADVWKTASWEKRHFAEGLGFWEVNVFKAFTTFFQTGIHKLSHGEFRARLAWAFITLGKVPYPADSPQPHPTNATFTTPGAVPEPPLPGGTHKYKRTPGSSGKTCVYCGNPAYQMCETCQELFGSMYPVCGAKSKRGRECMEKHANGEACLHSSFDMNSPAKRNMRAAWVKRKNPTDAVESSDESSDDLEDDSEDVNPRSPSDNTRGAKRAKRAAKAAKRAAQAAQQAAQHNAEQEAARAARHARRGIAQEA